MLLGVLRAIRQDDPYWHARNVVQFHPSGADVDASDRDDVLRAAEKTGRMDELSRSVNESNQRSTKGASSSSPSTTPSRQRRRVSSTGERRDRSSTQTPPRHGLVKFYDISRGFGYIAPDDGSPDVRFVVKVLLRDGSFIPRTRMPVSFSNIGETSGRPFARYVTPRPAHPMTTLRASAAAFVPRTHQHTTDRLRWA